MLTEGGDLAKLCDFGLALELKVSGFTTAESGTPLYYSPEMVKGEPYAFPADCWSFGVMLHELLSLSRPFTGNTTADLANAILNEKPPAIPSHYSSEIQRIVEALLIKDPAARMTMEELLSDPMFASRCNTFATAGYRPKMVEERLRRAHVRQLSAQIEQIIASVGQSSTSQANLDAVTESAIAVVEEEEEQEEEAVEVPAPPTHAPNEHPHMPTPIPSNVASPVVHVEHVNPMKAVQEMSDESDSNGALEEILLNTPYGGKKGQAIAEALEFSSTIE